MQFPVMVGKGICTTKYDLTPCGNIGNIYCSKAFAAIERIITNASDTFPNGDARKASAAIERKIPNAGDTIRDGDARKAFAAIERKIPNAGDTIRDGDAR